jgi:hypothetical protein
MKAIDNFNVQFKEEGKQVQLGHDISKFCFRIAKKKNGKPNSDYPSKYSIALDSNLTSCFRG